jgi:hypothetical protein
MSAPFIDSFSPAGGSKLTRRRPSKRNPSRLQKLSLQSNFQPNETTLPYAQNGTNALEIKPEASVSHKERGALWHVLSEKRAAFF